MKKIPISLIIDDPAPVVSVYHAHHDTGFTRDGRPILEYVPNELFFTFCEIVRRHGLKGKFSVVPMPGNRGDIINGIDGADENDVAAWLNGVRESLCPAFSVGPEMLTHNKAVDLATGQALPMNERDWASVQTEETLTPYVAKALSILREAGFAPLGVTSPWNFGIEVETDYVKAISNAVLQVCGSKSAWYFLRSRRDVPDAKPWVAYDDGDRCVVSIPATARDHFWQTIDTTQADDAFVSRVADEIITTDGKTGELIDILNRNGMPILITHWQSLVSNGLGTGLRALDEVATRIERNFGDALEWMSFEEILTMVLANKEQYPKPDFN